VTINNWRDGTISGTVEVYLAQGNIETLLGQSSVSGFATATANVPIALINLGSPDTVNIRVKFNGQMYFDNTVTIGLDGAPPEVDFMVPEVFAEGEPITFKIHATDDCILEAIEDIQLVFFPDVVTGGGMNIGDVALQASSGTEQPVFARYRIKIEGRAWNRLGYEINPHTSWVEIRERGDQKVYLSGDLYEEIGQEVPYVIYEIDRTREPLVGINEVAEEFEATVTMYVDFITTENDQIDGPVQSVVDVFLESGEYRGQGFEYEVDMKVKDWTDMNHVTAKSEHFDIEEDEETPQVKLWRRDHNTGLFEEVTNNDPIALWPNDQLYVEVTDNVSIHTIDIDIDGNPATFALVPDLTDQDYVFSHETHLNLSDDPAVTSVDGDNDGYVHDWLTVHPRYQVVYEAPDTPLATFTLNVCVTDRSYATIPVYVQGTVGIPGESEIDAQNCMSRILSINTRQDAIYNMLVWEGDLVSFATDTWYRHGRYVLWNNSAQNDFDPYPLTRPYEIRWPEYEVGNDNYDPFLTIVGGPHAEDTYFSVLVKKDIERVDVYLVKGFYPDTGSLVAAGIDLNNPENNPAGVIVRELTILNTEALSFANRGNAEKGVQTYANENIYWYWWRLDAADFEDVITDTGTYTFIVVPKDRTFENEWAVVETTEFPFIYDGPALSSISGDVQQQPPAYEFVDGKPEIILYSTPYALWGDATDTGPVVKLENPDRPYTSPEKFTSIMSLEIVDDYAGFNIDTVLSSDPVVDIQKQIHFWAPNSDDHYPWDSAERSFLDVYDTGSFWTYNINGYPAAEFVGLDVGNGNIWERTNWSNIKKVKIWARDELGNENTWETYAQVINEEGLDGIVIVDPLDGELFPPASPTRDVDVDAEDTGSDAESYEFWSASAWMHHTPDLGTLGSSPDKTITFTENGDHIIVVVGKDSNNNIVGYDAVVINVGGQETNAPTVTIMNSDRDDITGTVYTSTDDPTDVRVRIEEQSNFMATITIDGSIKDILNVSTMAVFEKVYSVSGLGEHPVKVEVMDQFGNFTTAMATVNITDNTPPSIWFVYDPNVASTDNSLYPTYEPFTVTVGASDVHTFNGTITVNGIFKGALSGSGMNQTDTSDVDITTNSTLTVTVRDAAGNTNTRTLYIYIDSIPPTATIDLGDPATGTTTTIDGTYTATDTNFAGARIDWELTPAYYGSTDSDSEAVDGGTDIGYDIYVGSGVDLSTLRATITAWDRAGNVATDSDCATVDNVFWYVEISNPSTTVVTTNTSITFDFLVQDAEIADAAITADSAMVTNIATDVTDQTYNPVICGIQFNNYIYEKSGSATATFSLPSATETTVTITLAATDLAGNSATTSITIVVDNKAPTLVGTAINVNQNYVDLQFDELPNIANMNATITIGSVNYSLLNASQLSGNKVRLTFDDGSNSTLDITTPCTVTFTGVYDQYGNGPTSGTVSF
jgi:hypothetical protein